MTHKKLLTIKAISEMYGIRLPTLYFWIRNKKFNYFKINKLIFIREPDFTDFLDQNKVDVDDE